MSAQETRTGRGIPPSLLLLLTLFVSGCSRPEVAAPPAENSLLVTGVQIVDTASQKISGAHDLLLVDGRIEAVEETGAIPPTSAARVLQAEGLYALPGLIDVHAHLGDGGVGEQTQTDREGALAQFLRYGVTTIFIPGGGAGNDDWLTIWKNRCRSGELRCPGIYGSGALITAPGSHPIGTLWGMSADTDPEQIYARGAVALAEGEPAGPLLDQKRKTGVDAIKVVIEDGIGPTYPMPRLSLAKVIEIVDAAHTRDLSVFAHVSMAQHVEDAVAAGADGVMHSSEEPLANSLLERMANQGTFYVATLALYDGFIDLAMSRFEQEEYARDGVSPRALESLRDFRFTPFPSPEEAQRIQSVVYENLWNAASAGVPLALGTDVNNPQVFPGYSTHEELALMVEAGLTPGQALAAATLGSAAFLGKQNSLARIQPGFEADLLLLAGNPLENIFNTRTLRYVVHDAELLENPVSAPITTSPELSDPSN